MGSLVPAGDGAALHMLVLDMQVLEASSRAESGPRSRATGAIQPQQRIGMAASRAARASDSEEESAEVCGSGGQEVALYGVTSEGSSVCCRVAGERNSSHTLFSHSFAPTNS